MSPCAVAALCAAVGGKLPDGNFYYTKATVAKRVQKAFERLVASVK